MFVAVLIGGTAVPLVFGVPCHHDSPNRADTKPIATDWPNTLESAPDILRCNVLKTKRREKQSLWMTPALAGGLMCVLLSYHADTIPRQADTVPAMALGSGPWCGQSGKSRLPLEGKVQYSAEKPF